MKTTNSVLTDELARIGWTVTDPRLIPARDASERMIEHPRCLAIDGLMNGVPRSAFICVDTNLVMMIGEMTDYPFSVFVDRVMNGEPRPAAAPVVARKRPAIRNLF